jgi:hypothetical protein
MSRSKIDTAFFTGVSILWSNSISVFMVRLKKGGIVVLLEELR